MNQHKLLRVGKGKEPSAQSFVGGYWLDPRKMWKLEKTNLPEPSVGKGKGGLLNDDTVGTGKIAVRRAAGKVEPVSHL